MGYSSPIRWYTSSHPWAGLNYLVKTDAEGKLRWERTGQLVDTTAGHWKDAGHGRGIVREERPDRPGPRPRTSFGSTGSISSISISPSESSGSSETAARDGSGTMSGNWRAVKNILSLRGPRDKLSKKMVKRSTWIYVSVGSNRLAVSFER